MPLETGDYISDLVITNPPGTDPKSQGDDHIRLLKKTVQQTFPNMNAAVDITPEQLNGFQGTLSGLTGMIGAFPIGNISNVNGWLLCNGQAVGRSTNPELFALIGTVYGIGDGVSSFNLPNYNGYFLRGVDGAAGIDPDADDRTDRGDGTTGNEVGTKQGHELNNHQHASAGAHTHTLQGKDGLDTSNAINGTGDAAAANAGVGTTSSDGAHTHDAIGGNETRPSNIYVYWYIHR